MKLTKREVELIEGMRTSVNTERDLMLRKNAKKFNAIIGIGINKLIEMSNLLTRILNESDKEE